LNHIRIGNVEVPTDDSGAVYLRFRHFDGSAYIPAWKVLAGQVPREEIEGRIIFVGTSAPGLLDLRATPLDAALPGVEIHAQVIENLLEGTLLTRPDYALALEEFVILMIGLFLAALLPRVSAKTAAMVGLLGMGSILVGGWVAFKYVGMLFDPSYPALATGFITAGITTFIFHGVEAQRSQIRDAFRRYLAPTVVDELISHPDKLKLGGEERELTLMFCDVRNFSAISQGFSAVDLTRFINELLSPLSEIILNQRGTIDKYMGDAIMAFWNAPVDDPDHRFHASCAALEMANKIQELNGLWRLRAFAGGHQFRAVKIGIGINTGQCCVGNLGSAQRFDYSAIGDEVNITSRFESLTKMYGVTAIVGQRALTPAFPALELDSVMVKGRTRPTKIYTLCGLLDAKQSQLDVLGRTYGKFLEAYRLQLWDSAEQLLGECRSIGVAQLEVCYALFEARIRQFRCEPPPMDWNGSFAMSEK
jgi:adenylate cyclase